MAKYYSDGERWSPAEDESNVYYYVEDGRLYSRSISNSEPEARRPWAYGFYDTHAEALRKSNIIRSKFDSSKWIQKIDNKWVQAFPYGQPEK
jgi:hypothetical protein